MVWQVEESRETSLDLVVLLLGLAEDASDSFESAAEMMEHSDAAESVLVSFSFCLCFLLVRKWFMI